MEFTIHNHHKVIHVCKLPQIGNLLENSCRRAFSVIFELCVTIVLVLFIVWIDVLKRHHILLVWYLNRVSESTHGLNAMVDHHRPRKSFICRQTQDRDVTSTVDSPVKNARCFTQTFPPTDRRNMSNYSIIAQFWGSHGPTMRESLLP